MKNKNLKISLIGSVPKWKEIENFVDWKTEIKNKISEINEKIEILTPDDFKWDFFDKKQIFWFSSNMLKNSDVVICQAEKKLWLWTAHEMLMWKIFGKKIISIVSKNSDYRKKNLKIWDQIIGDRIHSFLWSISDEIIENIWDLDLKILNPEINNSEFSEIVDESIGYYFENIK